MIVTEHFVALWNENVLYWFCTFETNSFIFYFFFYSVFACVENTQFSVYGVFYYYLFLFRTQRVLTPPFSDLVWLENGLVVKRMMQTPWLLRCCSHQYQEIKMSSGTVRIAAVLEEGGILVWPRNFIICEIKLSL